MIPTCPAWLSATCHGPLCPTINVDNFHLRQSPQSTLVLPSRPAAHPIPDRRTSFSSARPEDDGLFGIEFCAFCLVTINVLTTRYDSALFLLFSSARRLHRNCKAQPRRQHNHSSLCLPLCHSRRCCYFIFLHSPPTTPDQFERSVPFRNPLSEAHISCPRPGTGPGPPR